MTDRMHVVMFSGGLSSWAAAKRVAARRGTQNLILLFADTLIEDEDLYRFLGEAAAEVGGRLLRLADGRTPWEVFRDGRMIGNSRVAPCSRELKQEVCRRWVNWICHPQHTTLYVGINWDEQHRLPAVRAGWAPYAIEAPLCDPPYLSIPNLIDLAKAASLRAPRLYELGFPHNNCGGFCVRAGQSQFKRLLEVMPERFAHHEKQEERMRQELGKDVSILKERRGGRTIPLTLRQLRARVESGGECDKYEWGGCGCFTEEKLPGPGVQGG
jgi:hypothetical protein